MISIDGGNRERGENGPYSRNTQEKRRNGVTSILGGNGGRAKPQRDHAGNRTPHSPCSKASSAAQCAHREGRSATVRGFRFFQFAKSRRRLHPNAQDVATAVRQDRQREIDGFAGDRRVVANLDEEDIEEHHGR